MPAESNAPATLRVGVRPPAGNHQRVRLIDHSPTAAYMDEAIHEYLRADLVVPTVDELDTYMHGVAPQNPTIGREYRRDKAAALHAWLLERIEGEHPGSRWVMPGEASGPQVGMDGQLVEGDHDELA